MDDARVLRELAEEVERLSGPCEGMDARICNAVGVPCDEWPPIIPSYTRSIDAAMAMKPKRWRLANLREEPTEIGGWHAAGHRPSPGVAVESGTARTAALAIAALWLRALAADLEGTDATV